MTAMENPQDTAAGRPAGRIHLYLSRHGETVWNTEARMQGLGNSDLTENGLADARRLADALAGIPLLAAFTSPARRALETAQLALAGRAVPILVDDRIQEMALGRFEGLTVAEAYAIDPDNMDAFFHHAERFVPRGGESFAEVMKRIEIFLAELTADPLAFVGSHPALPGAAGITEDADDTADRAGATFAETAASSAGCGSRDPAGPPAGADCHILIISHNITVKAMLTIMRRRPLSRLRDGRHIPQATLIPVVYAPETGEYRLEPEAERIVG